ncbi:hypothetical protein ACJRO7_031177 [Eucalyptus globulus]|uniref:Uncharacterized protein n=1 Tax=Eucalyptus globulus TaxID=34317 RepID=A0ABD3JG33_EUCGL
MDPHSHHAPLWSHVTRWCACTGGREPVEPLAVAEAQSSSHVACTPACKKKLDGVALWVVSGIATAFFSSLERCSCIRLGTKDDAEDPSLPPLIGDQGRLQQEAGAEDEEELEVELEVEPSTAPSFDAEREQVK